MNTFVEVFFHSYLCDTLLKCLLKENISCLPMLTILTPSASAAFSTIDTLSIFWFANFGSLQYFLICFFVMISYKFTSFVPSSKPSSRLSICMFLIRKLAFTQLVKVSTCMSIQLSSDPFTERLVAMFSLSFRPLPKL